MMNELDIVVAEYRSLREELTGKFHLHLQIYSMWTSALLIFYGLMFLHKIYDLVMVVPTFALGFLFRILWEQSLIRTISEYILTEIEAKKVPMLIKTAGGSQGNQNPGYSDLWLGWQHFYKEKSPFPKYYKHSLFVLLLVVSHLPALAYNIYSIMAWSLRMPVVTILPIGILVLFLILNFSLGVYIAYKIMRM